MNPLQAEAVVEGAARLPFKGSTVLAGARAAQVACGHPCPGCDSVRERGATAPHPAAWALLREAPMFDYIQILESIHTETLNSTAASLGCERASLLNARENNLAGMIELAQLLGLPAEVVDALFEQRWALVVALRRTGR